MNYGSAAIDDGSETKQRLRILANEARNRDQLAQRLTEAHGLNYNALLREDFEEAVNKGQFHRSLLGKTLE
jgi:hypothetical protein